MSKGIVSESSLQSIAQAIRDGSGDENTYKPSEMARGIYDITFHVVPVQISNINITPGSQYVPTFYSYDFLIENDEPEKYPDLLYTGLLSKCIADTSGEIVSFTGSNIQNQITDFPYNVSSQNFDENYISGQVITTTDPRTEQKYAVYGKRKG